MNIPYETDWTVFRSTLLRLVGRQVLVKDLALWLWEFEEDVLPLLWDLGVHIRHAPYLYCLVRAVQPNDVVETGVWRGESTISIILALARNGHGYLHSCDVQPLQRCIERFSLCAPVDLLVKYWDFSQVPGVDFLKRLRPGSVDLFFHDSDHAQENQRAEYVLAYPLVKPGGFIGGDDTEWNKPPWAFHELSEQHGLKPVQFGQGLMARKPLGASA